MALPSPTDYGPWASATSTLPQAQNGFAERLIGSIRRECVDHIVVLGEAHLRRILTRYAAYYNELRTHRSLGKDAIHRAIQHVAHRIGAGPGRTSSPLLCPLPWRQLERSDWK
jgi:hypothetical protein